MAYRTVEESSLTGIADAIREAGGTEEILLFPDDFLTAISNMGGTGGTLTVLAPAGHTVTISKDGDKKTKIANDGGMAVFKGLSAGAWTYVITDGIQTSQPKTADVAYETTVTASYFAATIHIIYPAGSVCTVTDGVTTLTDPDPDKSGNWECHVPNTGTWTVSLDSGFREQVTISELGEDHTVDKWYLYNAGDEHTDLTGGFGINGWSVTGQTLVKAKMNAENIYFDGINSSRTAVGTSNRIKFDGFAKLCVYWKVTRIAATLALFCRITSNKNIDSQIASANNVSVTSDPITSVIPVDSVTDDAYVFIDCTKNAGTSGYVYNVWLEV